MNTPLTSTRRWTAIVLSVLGFGLGHISLGRWRRGCMWLTAIPICALLGTLSVHAMTLALALRLLSVVDCILLTRQPIEPSAPGRAAGMTVAALVGMLVLSAALRATVVEMFTAAAGSSRPNLEVGDLFVVNRLAAQDIPAGSLIVYALPCQPDVMYVGRIVGRAGQTVEVDAHGFVSVDGRRTAGDATPVAQPPADPHVRACPPTQYANTVGDQTFNTLHCVGAQPAAPSSAPAAVWPPQTQYRNCQMNGVPPLPFPWQVPEGHVFVLGDNRPNAMDGRFWGFLPVDQIAGPVQGVWWRAGKGLTGGSTVGRLVKLVLPGG